MTPTSVGNRLAFGIADPSHRGEEGMTYRMWVIGQLSGNSGFINPNFNPQDSAGMICERADALIAFVDAEEAEASSQVNEPGFMYKILRKIPFVNSLLS